MHATGRSHTGRSQALQDLRVLARVDDLSGLGQFARTLELVHGQVGDQAQVGAFAHHGRPAPRARRPQSPGDDGAGDLVGADANVLPQKSAFGSRRSGRDLQRECERPQHQGGGWRAVVEAMRIAGVLTGELG